MNFSWESVQNPHEGVHTHPDLKVKIRQSSSSTLFESCSLHIWCIIFWLEEQVVFRAGFRVHRKRVILVSLRAIY